MLAVMTGMFFVVVFVTGVLVGQVGGRQGNKQLKSELIKTQAALNSAMSCLHKIAAGNSYSPEIDAQVIVHEITTKEINQ